MITDLCSKALALFNRPRRSLKSLSLFWTLRAACETSGGYPLGRFEVTWSLCLLLASQTMTYINTGRPALGSASFSLSANYYPFALITCPRVSVSPASPKSSISHLVEEKQRIQMNALVGILILSNVALPMVVHHATYYMTVFRDPCNSQSSAENLRRRSLDFFSRAPCQA